MTSTDQRFWNETSLASRLEAGELIHWPVCPFPVPEGADAAFLRTHFTDSPDIALDPRGGRLDDSRGLMPHDAERLANLLREFSRTATGWLANELPEYAGQWHCDRATLRPEEEATRLMRLNARNDLLHVDCFPDRPAAGRRLLRLFVNLNPDEPRVWNTSVVFRTLLDRVRVPSLTEDEWCQPLNGLQRLLQRDWSGRPAYDSFFLRLQQSLRTDDEFQERSPKRLWSFAPGSAWLLFADGLSHAVLRGQFALEHSYFVPAGALVCRETSPLRQLVDAGMASRLQRAG